MSDVSEYHKRCASFVEEVRDMIGYGFGEDDIENMLKIVKARNRERDRLSRGEDRTHTLLTSSEAFIREAEEMGWGKTSDKALPGAFDALVEAVRQTRTGAPS